jgi:acetyl-CoA carboxylase carboxyl transferase subunit beta
MEKKNPSQETPAPVKSGEKKEIPEDLWIKCPNCGETLFTKELKRRLGICEHCGFYFKLSAKDRIELLVDPGSFKEIDEKLAPVDALGFVDRMSYTDRLKQVHKKTGLTEAIRTGRAKVGGHTVALGVMDFEFVGGSMGSVVGEKVTRLFELAIKERLPVIIVSTSGGARMQEGILSLMQMAKTNAYVSAHDDLGLLYLSVCTDPTTAGVMASYASVGDLNIAEPGALMGFAGPRVIKETIRQELPEGFQRTEFMLDKGFVDVVCERGELRDKLILLLDLFLKPKGK